MYGRKKSVPFVNRQERIDEEDPLIANHGQSRERRVWLKHTSGYFRFIGGFSGDTHHEDGGGPEM